MAQTNLVTTFAVSISSSAATPAYQPTTIILHLTPKRAEKALRLLQACGSTPVLADNGGSAIKGLHGLFNALLDAVPDHS